MNYEKLDNEQKELVKYWMLKWWNGKDFGFDKFIEKYLTPEPVIEAGFWYLIEGGNVWFVTDPGASNKGYGFNLNGDWRPLETNCGIATHLIKRKATQEEYSQCLIYLAIKKGFKAGQKIFSARTGDLNTIKNGYGSEFGISSDGFHFYYMDACVMFNGKWAEIIDEKAEKRDKLKRDIEQLEFVLKQIKSKL